jgi:signal transduction histidine kinase
MRSFITSLIGSTLPADEGDVQHPRIGTYRSWLGGELALVLLLTFATVLLWQTDRLDGFRLPAARLSLETTVALLSLIVAILAATRFRVDGRIMDLMLSVGFGVAALGAVAFTIVPALDEEPVAAREAWAGVGCRVLAALLVAVAPFVSRRSADRKGALLIGFGCVVPAVAMIWGAADVLTLDAPSFARTPYSIAASALLAGLALAAVVGFALRYRRHGRDLDSWLTFALTLILFAQLHYVLARSLSEQYVLQGDFLRLLAYGVLLVGVWRAIAQAEFGRAVAEERARVARDVHDGLAQYLFAISTGVSMLESGASIDTLLPRLKEAANAAQQEARFAVLALSSASGTAPFDAALRRYVDFLVADGALDVELELDGEVSLAPDEQIEVFRIVQEGLANARRHAQARRVWVELRVRAGRRVLTVRDDGSGFDGKGSPVGQGLRNMRRRADTIDGEFNLSSTLGAGTAIEVVLRAA